MNIIIDSKIRVRLKDIPHNILIQIKNDLSFDNPEYQYHLRSNNIKALRYTRKHIDGYIIQKRKLMLDRAYLNILLKYLKRSSIEYNLIYRWNEHQTDWFDDSDTITLRNYQSDAEGILYKYTNGVLVMPCGSGKTITLLSLIMAKHQWTLIIVHTMDLLNQWKEYVQKYLGKECGEIHGDVVNIQPLTIATVQTLSRRTLTTKFLNMWGCIVLDEAHHCPAETFTQVINQFPAKYRYGATATVHRSDKLEAMLFTVCGFPRYKITLRELEELGFVIRPQVEMVETNYIGSRRSSNYAKVVKHLINDRDRLQVIIDNLARNREHYNLVLSNRIEHLEHLYTMYSQIDDRCALLTGKVDNDERTKVIADMRSGNLHTIFATQLADEGLDIPILDRVHLTVSTKALGSIEQRIGRIQRIFPDKDDAIVYDYCDSMIPMFERHMHERLKFYQELGLSIGGVKRYGYQKRSRTLIPLRSTNKRPSIFEKQVARFTYRSN